MRQNSKSLSLVLFVAFVVFCEGRPTGSVKNKHNTVESDPILPTYEPLPIPESDVWHLQDRFPTYDPRIIEEQEKIMREMINFRPITMDPAVEMSLEELNNIKDRIKDRDTFTINPNDITIPDFTYHRHYSFEGFLIGTGIRFVYYIVIVLLVLGISACVKLCCPNCCACCRKKRQGQLLENMVAGDTEPEHQMHKVV